MGAKPTSETRRDSEEAGVPLPVLQGYDIVREIGHGSMGYVYECTSSEFGSVAVKVLSFFGEGSGMAVERFRREVTVGGRIGHPGIPTVYDSGRMPDGRFYLVMELLRGSDLEAWWDAPGHTRAEAVDLICQALEPLAAAHRHGVVHRDMKPENCFVEHDGRVRLLDFGVARSPDASQNLRTATGIAVGTPVYMSPEQATKPAEVGTTSDVWSAGVMLYEALCGELPFAGESPHAVVLRACTEDPTPLGDRVPEVHEELRQLVHVCLNRDPRERPQDAGALHAKLSALLQREDVQATLGGPAAAPSFRLSSSPRPLSASQSAEMGVAEGYAAVAAVTKAPIASQRTVALLALAAMLLALWLWSVSSTGSVAGAAEGTTDGETAAEEASGETHSASATAPEVDPPELAGSGQTTAAAGDTDRDSTRAEDEPTGLAPPTRDPSESRRRAARRSALNRPRAPAAGLEGARTERSDDEVSAAADRARTPEPAQPQAAEPVRGPEPREGSPTAPAAAPPPPTPTPATSLSASPPVPTTSSMSTTPRPQPMRRRPPDRRPTRPDFVTF